MVEKISSELVLDDLKDAFWRVTTTNAKGASTTKVLSHETYVNMLRKNTIVRKEAKKHSLGRIPYGYVDCLYGSQGNYEIAVMYPGKVRGVKYYKDTYRVPYPNTLYTYNVLKGVVQSKHCFAVIDDVITPETVLYRFPFGNVGSMGSMCYGNIHLPDCTELSSIDTLVELFLSGDVNDDLYQASDTAKNCKQFELYQFLQGKKKFPTKILVKDTDYGVKKEIRFKDIWK